jgi:hypothetical protein
MLHAPTNLEDAPRPSWGKRATPLRIKIEAQIDRERLGACEVSRGRSWPKKIELPPKMAGLVRHVGDLD